VRHRQFLIPKLIDLDLDLNQQDHVGESESDHTPLMYAGLQGHVELTKLLLDSGARRDVKNRWGQTPLKMAKSYGHSKIVNLPQWSFLERLFA
jgi:uncharacterized protein